MLGRKGKKKVARFKEIAGVVGLVRVSMKGADKMEIDVYRTLDWVGASQVGQR